MKIIRKYRVLRESSRKPSSTSYRVKIPVLKVGEVILLTVYKETKDDNNIFAIFEINSKTNWSNLNTQGKLDKYAEHFIKTINFVKTCLTTKSEIEKHIRDRMCNMG